MKHASQAYELLSEQVMHLCNGAEWKLVTFIARRTIGFGKEFDRMSIDQICNGIQTRDGRRIDHGTGLSRRAAGTACTRLAERSLIVSGREYHKPSNIGLHWPLICMLASSRNCRGAKTAPEERKKYTRGGAKTAHSSLSNSHITTLDT